MCEEVDTSNHSSSDDEKELVKYFTYLVGVFVFYHIYALSQCNTLVDAFFWQFEFMATTLSLHISHIQRKHHSRKLHLRFIEEEEKEEDDEKTNQNYSHGAISNSTAIDARIFE